MCQNFSQSNIESYTSPNDDKTSLAVKWCPSLDSSFDHTTLLFEAIALRIYPRVEYSEYSGIKEAHYAYCVCDRLRKEVLLPLRHALELPDAFMRARRWDELSYN
ncbi:Acrosin [Bienertia sinuspersici]